MLYQSINHHVSITQSNISFEYVLNIVVNNQYNKNMNIYLIYFHISDYPKYRFIIFYLISNVCPCTLEPTFLKTVRGAEREHLLRGNQEEPIRIPTWHWDAFFPYIRNVHSQPHAVWV